MKKCKKHKKKLSIKDITALVDLISICVKILSTFIHIFK